VVLGWSFNGGNWANNLIGKETELLEFIEDDDFTYISEQNSVSSSKQKVKPGVECN